jgi:hypothetical protein
VPENTVRDFAALYVSKGWQVVPLEPGSKAPAEDKWTKLIFKVEDFKPGDNIGLRSINGLVDVDCDAPEIEAVAEYFLPPTEAIFGRNGKARHWLYKSKFDKMVAYRDLAKTGAEAKQATLIELRVNHQSMAPPSIHPDGSPILWVKEGEPSEEDPTHLIRALRLAATCGLLIRYYNNPGNRHDWGLSIAGFFKTMKITEGECIKIFEKAAGIIGDTEIKDRIGTVRGTYNRGDDEPTKGSGGLIDLMLKGKEFVASIQRIWGVAASSFITGKDEKILANSQDNIRRAVEKLGIKLHYNQFTKLPIVDYNGYKGPLEDTVRDRMWLTIDEQFHFRPSQDFFDIVIRDIAWRNPMHPVREYLQSLKWDGTERINTWLIRTAKAADSEYVKSVSSMVLIAAVRRVMQPGVKFDEMMVLESKQGELKSSVLRALCPDPEWFSDDLPLNVDSKQVIERTTGKWIIEAQELSGMRKSDREHLKSMVSRQIDGPVRMAYARMPVSQPRQFIIIGTTNDHKYLQDPTGARRFWPIRIEKFNLSMVIKERDQLWAEAVEREAKNESIRLPEHLWEHAGLQQERRRVEDPWEEPLTKLFGDREVIRIAPDEIWEALGKPIAHRDERDQARLIKIMQRFGFRSMIVADRKKVRVRGWAKGEIVTTRSILKEMEKEENDDDIST